MIRDLAWFIAGVVGYCIASYIGNRAFRFECLLAEGKTVWQAIRIVTRRTS